MAKEDNIIGLLLSFEILLKQWCEVADETCDCEDCGPCKLAVETRKALGET